MAAASGTAPRSRTKALKATRPATMPTGMPTPRPISTMTAACWPAPSPAPDVGCHRARRPPPARADAQVPVAMPATRLATMATPKGRGEQQGHLAHRVHVDHRCRAHRVVEGHHREAGGVPGRQAFAQVGEEGAGIDPRREVDGDQATRLSAKSGGNPHLLLGVGQHGVEERR